MDNLTLYIIISSIIIGDLIWKKLKSFLKNLEKN